jgi:hypothetical protein
MVKKAEWQLSSYLEDQELDSVYKNLSVEQIKNSLVNSEFFLSL